MTIAELIRKLGGASEVAERLGITRQAVSLWPRAGHIPWKHHLAIQKMANDADIALTMQQIADLGGGRGESDA